MRRVMCSAEISTDIPLHTSMGGGGPGGWVQKSMCKCCIDDDHFDICYEMYNLRACLVVRNFSARWLYSKLTKTDIDYVIEYIIIHIFCQQSINL